MTYGRRQRSSKGMQARSRYGGGPLIFIVLSRKRASRIGSRMAREYCPRCGQKRRVCECSLRGDLPSEG